MSVTRPTLNFAVALVAFAGAFAVVWPATFVIANPPPARAMSASATTAAASANFFPLKLFSLLQMELPLPLRRRSYDFSWPKICKTTRLG